jgi:hypothetical protein
MNQERNLYEPFHNYLARHGHTTTSVVTVSTSRLDSPMFESSGPDILDEREVGDPVWPFLRLDTAFMAESSDVFAWDNRLEFGV